MFCGFLYYLRLSSPTSMKPCNYVTPHSPHQHPNTPLRSALIAICYTYICVTPLFISLLPSFFFSSINNSILRQFTTYIHQHTHISTVWHWIWLSLMHWRCRRIKVTYSKSMTGVQVLNCFFQLSSAQLWRLWFHDPSFIASQTELEEAVEDLVLRIYRMNLI